MKILVELKKNIKMGVDKYQLYKNSHGKHNFINRSKDAEDLCIILAGYKEFLWDSVFGRLEKYMPANIDVCIVSSGMYNEVLAALCKKNSWSYISVKRNNLCLALNLAIIEHPKAKNIYKIDEDMFITKEFFPNMKYTYEKVLQEGRYNIGYVAPLIPINGYGYIQLLKKYNKLDKFEQIYGKAIYTGGNDDLNNFTKNPNIPEFFWRNFKEIHNIDVASNDLAKRDFEYSICPIRFSIGSIYFKRKLWENMGMFDVKGGNGMAMDEIKLCNYCNTNSYATIISENCLVGHLAYGPQMEPMKEYYLTHKEQFI